MLLGLQIQSLTGIEPKDQVIVGLEQPITPPRAASLAVSGTPVTVPIDARIVVMVYMRGGRAISTDPSGMGKPALLPTDFASAPTAQGRAFQLARFQQCAIEAASRAGGEAALAVQQFAARMRSSAE